MYYSPYGAGLPPWPELVRGILRTPLPFLRLVVDARRWRQATAAAWGAGAGLWLGIGIQMLTEGRSWWVALATAMLGAALCPAMVAALAEVFSLSARAFGGEGSLVGLYCGLAYGSLPVALAAPLSLLLAPLPSFWGMLALLILFLWVSRLWVMVIGESHGLMVEFAVIAYLLPASFLLLALLAIFLAGVLLTLVVR